MKVLIGAGHHPNYPGACYFGLKEHDVVKRVVLSIYNNFKDELDLEVLPDKLGVSSYKEFMDWKVDWINKYAPDLYVEFHLNADRSGKGRGTETLIYPSSRAYSFASRLADLTSFVLGNRNRGVKERGGLYVLKRTKCLAIIYEVYFISNKQEVSIYNNECIDNVIGWVFYRVVKNF